MDDPGAVAELDENDPDPAPGHGATMPPLPGPGASAGPPIPPGTLSPPSAPGAAAQLANARETHRPAASLIPEVDRAAAEALIATAPIEEREVEVCGFRFQGQPDGSVIIRERRPGRPWARIALIGAPAWLELVAKTSWSGCSVKDVARLLQTKGAALTDKAEVEVLRAQLQQALGANIQLAVRNARVLASDVLLALAGAAALVCHLAGCTTASSVVLASAVGLVVLGRPVALFIAQRLAGIRPHRPR